MKHPSAKFVLTEPETWQFRRAQAVDPILAKEIAQLCEMNREIRVCYLLDTRKREGSDLKLTIALSLEDEKSQMDRVAAEFQELLGKFPAIAQNTAIMPARSFEKSYVGAEFYIRTPERKRTLWNWLSR